MKNLRMAEEKKRRKKWFLKLFGRKKELRIYFSLTLCEPAEELRFPFSPSKFIKGKEAHGVKGCFKGGSF